MSRKGKSLSRNCGHIVYLLLPVALCGCYEEDSGPHVVPYEPETNACLELVTAGEDQASSPQDILDVFDCLNSEGTFDALGAPLTYVIDTGYLNPYFELPGYLDPIDLEPYIEPGDPAETLQQVARLLNDPDQPVQALLDFYLDLYYTGHLEEFIRLGQGYAAYLYDDCPTNPEGCAFSALLDIAYDLVNDDALDVVQADKAAREAAMDPRVADDIAYDTATILRATLSNATQDGSNLLFDLVAAFVIDPIGEQRFDTATLPPYVEPDWTFLRAFQQPLCQLRSNRAVIDAAMETDDSESAAEDAMYLALNLRTLVNYTPDGTPTGAWTPDTSDKDNDGVSVADGDCNDTDSAVYPGAIEVEDGKDNDCNLVADDDLLPAEDQDGDQVSINAGDCDDTDATIHPGLKISMENGSVIVIDAAPEFTEDGTGDGKDNDCDGYVDHRPSSLEILLAAAAYLLPETFATDEETGDPMLYTMVETMANGSGSTIDPVALLEDNEQLVEDTVSNLSNGMVSPEMTVQLRILLPVVYQLVDMGMLDSTSSSSALLTAIYDDHLDYVAAYAEADDMERGLFDAHRNACGEDYDRYIDALEVLVDLLKLVDGYEVLSEPNLNELIPIVINSGLLEDQAKAAQDLPAAQDPELIDAQLHLFDYFVRPSPEAPGVYYDNYTSARLWTLVPLIQLLYEDPRWIEDIDSWMIYAFDGAEDPSSALYALPSALEALSNVGGGGSVDRDGLANELLDPDPAVRNILINLLAIPADPDLVSIILGDWEALPEELREAYYRDESTLAFTVRWIENGTVGWLLDLAADIADTLAGEFTSSTAAGGDTVGESTPLPAEPTPGVTATPLDGTSGGS